MESGAPAPETSPAPAEQVSASLFFIRGDLSGIDRVEVNLPDRREAPSAQLEEIVRGLSSPPSPGFLPVFSSPRSFRSAFLGEDGTVWLDLARPELPAVSGGVEFEMLALDALLGSIASALPEAVRLKVLVDGADRETFLGHVDLRNAIELHGRGGTMTRTRNRTDADRLQP